MVGFHDRKALCGDGVEEGVGMGIVSLEGWWTREGLDEDNAFIRMRGREMI